MTREYGDTVTFVGVAGRSDLDEYADFVARHDLGNVTHAIDPDGQLWARFGVSYQPAWVFIDDSGAVEVVAGALYGDDLRTRLDALVAG